MKSYTFERPSLLPAFCAPTSASWLPIRESIVVLAAERAQLSQVHQVRIQAELARTLVTAGGSYGTSGLGTNGLGSRGTDSAEKPMAVVASGVPPRGRPV